VRINGGMSLCGASPGKRRDSFFSKKTEGGGGRRRSGGRGCVIVPLHGEGISHGLRLDSVTVGSFN